MAARDIGKKTKVGILYNTAARLAGTFGQIFSSILLARLLVPSDFGAVATAMMTIGFATKFGEFGFHMGLIQRKEDITRAHVDTLFVMDFTFKLILYAVIYAATPYIARFFHNPDLEAILPVLGLYILLECFSATPLTVLKREMNFKVTSIIGAVESFVAIISSVVMAYLGLGYWSLVYSQLLGVTVSAFLATGQTGWYPRFRYDRQAGKDLFRFGVMISLRNLFRYGSDKVDYFFISRYLGAQALGFYEKAFELMRLPQRRITRSINRVIFSAFARIQDEPERIRKAFRKLILAISLLSYPMLAGLAFVAPVFVPVALGEKWQPTVVPLQIMCVAGILRSMDPFLNSLLTATGFVKSTVTRRAVEFLLLATASFVGVHYGIIGVSIGIVVSYFIVMFLMLSIITRLTPVNWGDYFGAQLPAFVTTLGMLASLYLNNLWLQDWLEGKPHFLLIAQTLIGGVTYLALHGIFRFSAVRELLSEVTGDFRGLLKRKRVQKKTYPEPQSEVQATEPA